MQHANADLMAIRPSSPEMVAKAVQCVMASTSGSTIPSIGEQQSNVAPSIPNTQLMLSTNIAESQAQQQADFCHCTTLSFPIIFNLFLILSLFLPIW